MFYNPNSLKKACIDIINIHMDLSASYTITESSDVCTLNKNLKSCNENLLFIASNEKDLPICLQPKKAPSKSDINSNKLKLPASNSPKLVIISDVKVNPTKKVTSIRKKLNIKKTLHGAEALTMKLNPKTKYRKHQLFERKNTSKKKRKINRYESSSENENSDIMSITNTDSSGNELFEDYITKYLQEEDMKENLEQDIPFGFSDISYFTGKSENLKKDDWILAKFATKKSLKHYVGQVLSVKNDTPTIQFLRKVKSSKDRRLAFTYPNVVDICEMMHLEDIILVLPQPNISRRGQIIFEVNLSEYNIQ
ncbi:unnamed protein product [Diatraea saccharalis]|uniref:Uncharacterized protein n=1 Tax=Diatraea saccharalis TaxID=40085 RepID=A0A9N9W9X6_9NEOP|nr:unnamed protein product [Diatraea saccharalis]